MYTKFYIVVALIVLGMSLFIGIVGGSGLGSFFPALNQIAKPFVCGTNIMQVDQHVFTYRPGATSYTITVFCVDGTTGAKKDVTTRTQFTIGLISSAVLFLPLLFLVFWGINRLKKQQAAAGY